MDNREQADNFYKSGKWAEAIEMYAKCKGDSISFANRRYLDKAFLTTVAAAKLKLTF
jgi:hypothetical protein